MKISFIGYGNMAKAMIAGILKSQILEESDIFTSDSNDENQAAVDFGDYIFLTIKPQLYKEVLALLSYGPEKLFVTVAPGISSASINAKVVRTMPNTPALIGEGVTAICRNSAVSDAEYDDVIKLFSSFSTIYQFSESQMDEIVALSGSSPAYTYLFIDALARYSASQGIDYAVALKIAAQTVIGSAKMILTSKDSPSELCQKVCSPGGTTIKAVEVLNENNFETIIAQAMAACNKRAKELAQELE